jgi:hypothetical protein
MYVEQRLLTRFIYGSLVVFLVCTSALLPAPVFSRQLNTITTSASYANDSMEQLAQIINSQAKAKTIVTVDGKQYYIVVLKNRIDPATLKPQFTPDFTKEVKVYTNPDGTPVSNHDTVNKIQCIDSARRWSAGQASAASIKEDLQIIDDFTKAMLKVRAYEIALDWIATAGGEVVKLYICDSLNPKAFCYYIPEQLMSTFANPKNAALLLGYKFMNDSKRDLEDALAIAERGEINDYDNARQFMESYLRGWTEFSPAYSMVFESFVGGSWQNDLEEFVYKLAKSILPISLRKEFFGDIEKAGMIFDMTPINRFYQLKSECDRVKDEFFKSSGVHTKYTLELAKAGILLRSSPAEPAETASPPISTQTAIVVDPRVSVSPTSGEQGTTFSEPGWGFYSDHSATLHFRGPDGRELTPVKKSTDGQGRYSHSWTSSTTSPLGTYSYWAVDDKTGEVSNTVNFTIQAKVSVNPQLVISATSISKGQIINIKITGCTPNNKVKIDNEPVSVYWFAITDWYKTCNTDSSGNAITSIAWPSLGASYKGEYAVYAIDAATKTESNRVIVTVK